jgi:hypothetical protein
VLEHITVIPPSLLKLPYFQLTSQEDRESEEWYVRERETLGQFLAEKHAEQRFRLVANKE